MTDSDAGEPQNPLKRFRGDYGQSADEEQRSNPPDEIESVNEHRSPQQQIYMPESISTQHHQLRFPENRTDESYLVLEAEEPVKSKPHAHGATAMRRPSDTSGSSSDDGIAMGYQQPRKPHQRSSKKRPLIAADDARDDDTGSERNEVVESMEGEFSYQG